MYLSFNTPGLVLGLTMLHIHYILKSLFQAVKQPGSESYCLYVFGTEVKNMKNDIFTTPYTIMTYIGTYLRHLEFITLRNQ